MGESITQGVLATWNKGVGDFVSVDEVVASIETDKVGDIYIMLCVYVCLLKNMWTVCKLYYYFYE